MHHHILEIDGDIINRYMKERQIDIQILSKSSGLERPTIRKIYENLIPLRYIAFYRLLKVLRIDADMIIKDRDILLSYQDYVKEYENEIAMPQYYFKMTDKRNRLLDKQFRELMEEL